MKILCFVGAFMAMSTLINAQIMLQNPSFEDTPADATMPSGWWGIEKGTTPDIQPGFWGVDIEANDGDTFIGLITRSDGSYECIGQRLSTTLSQDACYSMSIDLAKSEGYVGYSKAISLNIYLGSKKKDKAQLIYSSQPVDNLDWQEHTIDFTPNNDYRYIIIEASNGGDETKTGNILIDNISLINPCDRA